LGETRDAELPNYVNDKTAWEKARDEAVAGKATEPQ
jgi:hypothetical protein